MQSRYKNVRNWLLSKERYEDIIKFDKSDEAKEALYCEMTGESYTDTSSSDYEDVRLKSTGEINKEIFERYHYIIEQANDSPSEIKDSIMHLIKMIAYGEQEKNTREYYISFLKKYGRPGK